MDRRKSIKTLFIGGFSISAVAEACRSHEPAPLVSPEKDKDVVLSGLNRMKEEIVRQQKIDAEPAFFTASEMASITALSDIIIPKDAVSGSASDARVPAFIEYIVKDMPEHKIPLRGGLRWLDLQCLNRFGNDFRDCTPQQQLEMVDRIAWPKKAKPEMSQGVAFFNLMRNLVATGFFTSEIGVKDIGYMGNVPNQWNGVPDEVLKQYHLAYSERELKESIHFS